MPPRGTRYREQTRHEVEGLEDEVRGAVAVRRLELVTDVSIRRE